MIGGMTREIKDKKEPNKESILRKVEQSIDLNVTDDGGQ